MPASNKPQDPQEKMIFQRDDEQPEVLAHGMERPQGDADEEQPEAEGHLMARAKPEDEDEGPSVEAHLSAR